ncbi:MAG TPA: D-aminoacyl-tRNA deacylase [Chloroflexota bacterium]|nr:D-aminoacyl-tRNA deacylase [Chloroflexota bacterium]
MKAVIQRVARSSVSVVEGDEVREISRIGHGLTVLIGVATTDTPAEARRLADKIAGLRIFDDAEGKLNLDVREVGGEVLAISQFTLLADARKGRRPSFIRAARPEAGEPLYEAVVSYLRAAGLTVRTGRFGAHMHVDILNDGPVTILLDTAELGGA